MLLLNLNDYMDKAEANGSSDAASCPFPFLSSYIFWKSTDWVPPLSQQTETKVKSGFPKELQVHIGRDGKKRPHQALI